MPRRAENRLPLGFGCSMVSPCLKREPMNVGQLRKILKCLAPDIEIRVEGEYGTGVLLGMRIVRRDDDEKVLHLQTDVDDD